MEDSEVKRALGTVMEMVKVAGQCLWGEEVARLLQAQTPQPYRHGQVRVPLQWMARPETKGRAHVVCLAFQGTPKRLLCYSTSATPTSNGLLYLIYTNLLANKYSAICTALVAAPLRRLSETIHMLRVLGCVSSTRKRPTNTSSRSWAFMGMG